jgi:heme/copper-type cytochrome/quinol oxidase subunit 4
MAKLHLSAAVLVLLALLSTVTAGGSGSAATLFVLAAAAAKGTAVLHYFLGLRRATPGWRVALVGFVLITCAAAGAIQAIGGHLDLAVLQPT